MHPYPLARLQELFQHRMLANFPYRELGLLERQTWPEAEEWNAWSPFTTELRFVTEIRPGARRRRKEKKAARMQPGLRSYEAQIIEASTIPTRPAHAHDFFNALVWLSYPQSKQSLHRRAYALQGDTAALTSPNRRSPLIDRLTCLDEGGVLFVADPAERDEVCALFASRRDPDKVDFLRQYHERFWIFGHGLLECLLRGESDLNVSCLTLSGKTLDSETLDQCLGREIEALEAQSPHFGTIPFAALWRS